MDTPTQHDRVAGVLLGTAIGDALGLPREGLSRDRAARFFGGRPLTHRFLKQWGMFSDDTEHTCMVAQALLASRGDPEKFAKSLAWRLRFWLLGIPAGVGFATLKGICRLWLGFSPSKSGVHSAGNGPAMRSGLLGVYAGDDVDYLKRLVAASTRLTHNDERAEQGALVVALACQYAASKKPEDIRTDDIFEIFELHITNQELLNKLMQVKSGVEENLTAIEMADRMALINGITGYIIHTVPIAIFCWLRHRGDFKASIETIILLGGDTDTTGAIVGAMAGASVGSSGIAPDLLNGIIEWPLSVKWIRRLAVELTRHLDNEKDTAPLGLFWPGLILRNIVFTLVVLTHGLRRLFPPY